MCMKLFLGNLNSSPYPPHPTSTYTCGVKRNKFSLLDDFIYSSFMSLGFSVTQYLYFPVFRLVKHWVLQQNGLTIAFTLLVSLPTHTFWALNFINRLYAALKWVKHVGAGGLELLDGPEPEKILIGPRVGIEYALPEHVNALWRFAIAGTPWISAPKNTLRPPWSFIHCSNKLLLDSKEWKTETLYGENV